MYPFASRMVGARHLSLETRQLIARFSAAPDPARARHLNRAIRDLKAAGLYTNTKLKGLYVHAAHDAQAGRQNWIENASNLSVVGAMTFTTDRGYAGDGGTAELTASGTADSTSSHIGIWVNSYGGGSGYMSTGGAVGGWLRTSTSGETGRWAAIADQSATGAGAYGVMSTIDAGANLRFYKNGAFLETDASGGSGLSLGTISIALGHTGRHAVSHWGADLTTGEIAALYAILNTYLTAIGAA